MTKQFCAITDDTARYKPKVPINLEYE